MGTKVRVATPEEEAAFAHDGAVRVASPEELAAFDAAGEPGQPGHDPYAAGPSSGVPTGPITPHGTWGDAAKTFANKAALGAGPQLEGVIAAIAHAATDPMQTQGTDVDAYRYVRDEGKRQHDASEHTVVGEAIAPIATLATPVPVKPLGPGATLGQKALQGAKVGGGVGFVSGAVNSKADLTRPDPEQLKRLLVDAVVSGGAGTLAGGAGGAVLGAAEPKLRTFAEEQALKAAGLRGGISNQVQRKLGLSTPQEARQVGRQFLDEELIPFAGSKESVQKRAQQLADVAGNAKSAVLNQAETSGKKFDYDAFADTVRRSLDGSSAVADELSGSKARALADALEHQGARTPGSFVGADKAKSDAWKSARFDDDAPMSAVLYRKGVGAARDNLESQVGAASGPGAAKALRDANQKFGVAADALKLANDAATRDQSNSSLGLREQLMLAAGLGGGAGAGVGHAGEGLAMGVGGALLNNWGRKHGNAAAARIADFFANRAAQNTGGVTAGALAPYLQLLEEPDK